MRIDAILSYSLHVQAVFVELPPFQRHRAAYLDDDAFQRLQRLLMLDPEAGDVIPGTGGLRKLRFLDERRGKGKRGGLRNLLLVGRRISVLAIYSFREG